MLKVAVNGFGRIGRCFTRACLEENIIIPAIINSNKLTPDNASHMLQYDSVHGRLNGIVQPAKDAIIYNDKKICISDITSIDKLRWDDIDIVFECTGISNSKEQSYHRIENGARAVIVSAPCINADVTVICGVNDTPNNINGKVISVGSCTTNCLAPVIKPLNDALGITSAFMTTIHAYTNDQCLLDSRHSDLRRGRSAATSIIPTSTGAAGVIGNIIPELKGKIDGIAIRVPVQNVSMIDLTFTCEKSASVQDINDIMRHRASQIPKILGINNEPLVSIDFNHTQYSAIFDTTQTKVVYSKLYRIVAWYDNEWGFVSRMLDMCHQVRL